MLIEGLFQPTNFVNGGRNETIYEVHNIYAASKFDVSVRIFYPTTPSIYFIYAVLNLMS